jgi:hypothetical protein
MIFFFFPRTRLLPSRRRELFVKEHPGYCGKDYQGQDHRDWLGGRLVID